VSEEDIAAQLDGVAGLETIVAIEIEQQRKDGTIAAVPAQLGPAELLHLGPDGIDIEFAVPSEATA
jgi:hypothetical protein